MLAERCILGLALLPAVIGVTIAGCDTPTQESDEEGGRRYAPTETARETRRGIDLVMRYEAANQRFTGTVTNTTSSTVAAVRVEIHLSNGEELGPTPRKDLGAGESVPVTLDAGGQDFDWWSVHAETGGGGGG